MTVAFMIMCFIAPLMFLAGFFYGFKIAKEINQRGNISSESFPLNRVIAKAEDAFEKVTETEEERLQRIINENIENFGTNIPQKEVE